MPNDQASVLASIVPSVSGKIMDLVAEAGIDVSAWAFKQDGSPVKNPSANPHFCYEWAFGGNKQPTALCVWHKDIAVVDGNIAYEDSLRQFALKLDVISIDQQNPAHVRSRARDQAKRARNFDSLVQRAYRQGQPARIILLLGEDKGIDQLGWDTSRVNYRSLDTEPWYVHSYSDEDGTFRIVRSLRASNVATGEIAFTESMPQFVDQFSIPDQPDRVAIEVSALPRSREVRRRVLERAKGICECCNTFGFKMANGSIYLETHHVIPLAQNGPDVEWNVVAICPNDHRRAHFAVDREALRGQFVERLQGIYPDASEALRDLTEALIVETSRED